MNEKKRLRELTGNRPEGEGGCERVFDVRKFYLDLDGVRRSRRESWRAVARATGQEPGLFTRMGLAGRGCSVGAFLSLLEWSGLKANDYSAPPHLMAQFARQ